MAESGLVGEEVWKLLEEGEETVELMRNRVRTWGYIYMTATVAQSLEQIELCVHPGELALRLVRSVSNRVARNV